MPDEYLDPSGDTEQFRAFAHAPDAASPADAAASRLPLLIGVAVVVAAVVVVTLWLALS
ncbi:hypothetical protein ACIG87_26895 [Micromonospora sp. NPDC051925]|uniref:hypothetical protein n=1 Tax=Micromonospora sp. NPDC051925 TaxID=3364288 RepID=UPI0037C67E3C